MERRRGEGERSVERKVRVRENGVVSGGEEGECEEGGKGKE